MSKVGASKLSRELFALFDCRSYLILSSAALSHTLSGMRVKMNYHGSIPFNVPTASSKQPGGRFFDRCASQFWATACASPAAPDLHRFPRSSTYLNCKSAADFGRR